MNKNAKTVFEMLGVEPNEEFRIFFPDTLISNSKYKIGEKLEITQITNSGLKGDYSKYLNFLLTGEFKIIKQPKFTDIEQKAIELYKLLGAKYIAKDYDSTVWCFKHKPCKHYGFKKWCGKSVSSVNLPTELEFSSLNWSDKEPYYIGD